MQARIYMPTKSSMQSGDGKDFWILEFVKDLDGKFKENLMGRTASKDMSNEVRIKFPTLKEATAFAEKRNYDFEIIQPKKPKLIKKTYASNFR
jgi:hypothetical protein